MRLLLFTILISYGAAATAQTKEETIDWLNSKLPKDPYVAGDIFKSYQTMKIHADGSFTVVLKNFAVGKPPSKSSIESIYLFTGHFRDLSPTSIKIRKDGNVYFLDLTCQGSKECIKITKIKKGPGFILPTGISFGAFPEFEENILQRLKKAFTRLIILCGGKEETF
jgi:hypothetical protein